MQEGIFLTKFADKITILDRGNYLTGSPVLVERAQSDPKIEVLNNPTEVEFNCGRWSHCGSNNPEHS